MDCLKLEEKLKKAGRLSANNFTDAVCAFLNDNNTWSEVPACSRAELVRAEA